MELIEPTLKNKPEKTHIFAYLILVPMKTGGGSA